MRDSDTEIYHVCAKWHFQKKKVRFSGARGLTSQSDRGEGREERTHHSVSHLLFFSFSRTVPASESIDPRWQPVEEAETTDTLVCVDSFPPMGPHGDKRPFFVVLFPISPRGHRDDNAVHLLHWEGRNWGAVAIKLASFFEGRFSWERLVHRRGCYRWHTQGRQGRALRDLLSREEALKGLLLSVVFMLKGFIFFFLYSWVWVPSVTSQRESLKMLSERRT